MDTSPRTASIIALFLSAIAVGACADRAPADDGALRLAKTPVATDDGTPAYGAREPKVIVSLFTDYQCPNCRRAGDVAHRLLDRWPEEVQVRFHHLPLEVHPLAIRAAVAAQAAHRQGRFLCMHSALARTRMVWAELDEAGLGALVRDVLGPRCGLDAAAFARDQEDPVVFDAVIAARERSRDLGVPGTPYLYVNGLEADAWPRPNRSSAQLVNALVRAELRDIAAGASGSGRCDAADWRCRVFERMVANTGDEARARLFLD